MITTAKKNNIAKARDEWFANPENKACLDDRTVSHEYYLRNRLERAFCDGWSARARQYGIKEPQGITEPIIE